MMVRTSPEWSKTGEIYGATMWLSPLVAIGAVRHALNSLLLGEDEAMAMLSLAVVLLWPVAVGYGIRAIVRGERRYAVVGLMMAALVAVLPPLGWVVLAVYVLVSFVFGTPPP